MTCNAFLLLMLHQRPMAAPDPEPAADYAGHSRPAVARRPSELTEQNKVLNIETVMLEEKCLALEFPKDPAAFMQQIQDIEPTNCPEDFQEAWRGHIADLVQVQFQNSMNNREMLANIIAGIAIDDFGIFAIRAEARGLARHKTIQTYPSHALLVVLQRYGFRIE